MIVKDSCEQTYGYARLRRCYLGGVWEQHL